MAAPATYPAQSQVKFNASAPGANTNIFTTAITPRATEVGSVLRISVCLATGSVFNVTATKSATTKTMHLNGGTALTAACLYTFIVPTQASTTYNFQVATDGIIDYLTVDEIMGGVI